MHSCNQAASKRVDLRVSCYHNCKMTACDEGIVGRFDELAEPQVHKLARSLTTIFFTFLSSSSACLRLQWCSRLVQVGGLAVSGCHRNHHLHSLWSTANILLKAEQHLLPPSLTSSARINSRSIREGSKREYLLWLILSLLRGGGWEHASQHGCSYKDIGV